MGMKDVFKRYLVFVIGLYFLAAGIVLIVRSALGTTPISSINYVLSLNSPLSLGTCTFLINMLLVHGANYLTDHLYSSPDIKFITLSISESMRTDDSYLTQITAILLATMRQNKQYTIQLTAYEAQIIRNELEVLMRLLNIKHQFLFRRIQAACNALFLDIADFLSRKTIIKKEVSRKDHVLQEFHALVTRNFREEHFVSFYADKLAISEQYLARIVRAGTGKSVNTIINELLIMEARTLLSSTKSTVGDIASRLGFSDAAGFCKFFKRNMGQTPLNYRKGLWI